MSFTGPGFFAEPITLSTDGRIEPGLLLEIDLTPREPTPQTLQERADANLARQHGVDLEFNREGDFEIAANGDLVLTQGLGALKDAFSRAIATAPAEIYWRPDYGVGATEFLHRHASQEIIHQLKNRIRETLMGHVAVDELLPIEVVMQDGGALIEVSTTVIVAGRRVEVGLRVGRS